ncbi:hypothetical protein XBP1_1830001 [Xenorhabdus bovienii str. puntauvense]|uniref:Uncharacterized protein n=1 Tax=Xenorhabdus bovienii str. puntauvense TaxID=1398201 RepID=A0A077NAH4_XENBV|nr:hypothetical protein XBP1_1830001 [Xenorhabdus bovienii str. puntauvense]
MKYHGINPITQPVLMMTITIRWAELFFIKTLAAALHYPFIHINNLPIINQKHNKDCQKI